VSDGEEVSRLRGSNHDRISRVQQLNTPKGRATSHNVCELAQVHHRKRTIQRAWNDEHGDSCEPRRGFGRTRIVIGGRCVNAIALIVRFLKARSPVAVARQLLFDAMTFELAKKGVPIEPQAIVVEDIRSRSCGYPLPVPLHPAGVVAS
jgi:hypothetical protein